ncbi:MAG: 2OG-Fe(II) oxygenase [Proteobacteria bacterium]|nr:2OG-Fe(II) oxygenase [Pseudomonadota bacterium]
MEARPSPLAALDRPPPHGVVRDWLGTAAVARLLAYAQAQRSAFAPSKMTYGTSGRVKPERRRSEVLYDLPGLGDELRERFNGLLPAMTAALGAPPFVPSKFELELVAHNDGAFFARHIDTRIGRGRSGSRAISAVYYFHREPRAFSGGVLRLYSVAASGAPGSSADVPPDNDTLVYFPSWYPHEVTAVTCPSGAFEDSRFAINCWIHRAAAAV